MNAPASAFYRRVGSLKDYWGLFEGRLSRILTEISKLLELLITVGVETPS